MGLPTIEKDVAPEAAAPATNADIHNTVPANDNLLRPLNSFTEVCFSAAMARLLPQ